MAIGPIPPKLARPVVSQSLRSRSDGIAARSMSPGRGLGTDCVEGTGGENRGCIRAATPPAPRLLPAPAGPGATRSLITTARRCGAGGSPFRTWTPSWTAIETMRPARGALTLVSIFIASSTSTTSPATTDWPGCTPDGAHGSRERRRERLAGSGRRGGSCRRGGGGRRGGRRAGRLHRVDGALGG